MEFKFSDQTLVQNVMGLVRRVIDSRWAATSEQRIDGLYAEIYQLEKTLANAPTRPSQVIRSNASLLEPTEQEKIMDMSG